MSSSCPGEGLNKEARGLASLNRVRDALAVPGDAQIADRRDGVHPFKKLHARPLGASRLQPARRHSDELPRAPHVVPLPLLPPVGQHPPHQHSRPYPRVLGPRALATPLGALVRPPRKVDELARLGLEDGVGRAVLRRRLVDLVRERLELDEGLVRELLDVGEGRVHVLAAR